MDQPTYNEDTALRHYQPAGTAPVCGAGMRIIKAIEAGTERDKYAVLKIHKTTDVRKVQCPHCRAWILNMVSHW